MTFRPFCKPKIFDDMVDLIPALGISLVGVLIIITSIVLAFQAPSLSGSLLVIGILGGFGIVMIMMGCWIVDINMNPFGWKDCNEGGAEA